MRERPVLLWVLENGGYPDFTALYEALGYRVEKAVGVRKALAALKRLDPAAVVAELNYVPTYGARLSPAEPLLARLQTHHRGARVVLFAEPGRIASFAPLTGLLGDAALLAYPIVPTDLERILALPQPDPSRAS